MSRAALLSLVLLACSTEPAPKKAPKKTEAGPKVGHPEGGSGAGVEPTAAAHATEHHKEEGKSLPFVLTVGVSPEAKALLTSKGEKIAISVDFLDGADGDDGGYRREEFEVEGDGGIVDVPAVDLSPVKAANGPLTEFSINVYSARKSSTDNLINCTYSGGPVAEIAPRMVIECKPL